MDQRRLKEGVCVENHVLPGTESNLKKDYLHIKIVVESLGAVAITKLVTKEHGSVDKGTKKRI